MNVLTLRRLHCDGDDITALQRVLDAAPAYAMAVTGSPPTPDDARQTLTELPPGTSAPDKFVFGAYLADELVGCVDLVRGYPEGRCAFIGLLLIAEPYQRSGLGAELRRETERVARSWGGERIRLGVVKANAGAFPYWRSQGFALTGETKPYREGLVESEVLVMEKRLA